MASVGHEMRWGSTRNLVETPIRRTGRNNIIAVVNNRIFVFLLFLQTCFGQCCLVESASSGGLIGAFFPFSSASTAGRLRRVALDVSPAAL